MYVVYIWILSSKLYFYARGSCFTNISLLLSLSTVSVTLTYWTAVDVVDDVKHDHLTLRFPLVFVDMPATPSANVCIVYLPENSFSVHCVLTWEHYLSALCTNLRITKLVKLYISARCTYVRTFFRLSMACSNFSLSQCVLGVFFKISENITDI